MTAGQTAKKSQPPNPLRGRLFCILDSQVVMNATYSALHAMRIEDRQILAFSGPDAVERLNEWMQGSQWGESAETAYQDGISALNDGKSVLIIEASTLEAAQEITAALQPLGAHSVFHFGDLVDTQLTA